MAPTKNAPQQIDDSVFDDTELLGINEGEALPTGSYALDLATVEMEEKPVPPGNYNAQITGAKQGAAKASGNPMITLKWKITDGAYAGRTIRDYLVFVKPTGDWNKDYPLRKIRATLEAIGYPASDAAQGIDPERLIGSEATIKVKVQPGKGTNAEGKPNAPSNQVELVLSAGSVQSVSDLL